MRWTPKPLPDLGTLRVRVGFLWLPKKLNGEWRWLEYAAWSEEFVSYYEYGYGWEARAWEAP